MDGEAKYRQQHEDEDERFRELLDTQAVEYLKRKHGGPGFLAQYTVWVKDWDVEFTVGDVQQMDVLLPNVATSTWQLEKDDVLRTGSEKLRDGDGRTPLHCAAVMGHIEAVKLLLEYTDADVNVIDSDGKTAAELALDGNFYDVYAAIQTHGME